MNDKKIDKPKSKKILLVSYYFPTRAHAGGLRILDMYSKIKEQSPDTIIDLFSFERPEIDWKIDTAENIFDTCLLYTSPSPRDGLLSRMPSSA